MNIGDKVRFLNDVGGGKITGFQPGGIVLVEDEDGFDIPVPAAEVVVVETNENNFVKNKPAKPAKPREDSKEFSKDGMTIQYGRQSSKPQAPAPHEPAAPMTDGKEYLKSKSASDSQDDVDENLEARVIRLEMRVKQLEMILERMQLLEAKRKDSAPAPRPKKIDKNEIIEIDLHSHEVLDNTRGMSGADIKEYQIGVFIRTMNQHKNERGRKIVFIHGKGNGVLRRAIEDELRRNYKSCEYQDASFQQYGFGATQVTIR